MREEYIEKTLEIPENVTVTVDGETVTVSHKKYTLTRTFPRLPVSMTIEGKIFKVYVDFPRKQQKAMCGTVIGHVKNMIEGVTNGFEYRLKIVYSHFPIDVKVKGNQVEIHDLYGEKNVRKAQILPGVTVKLADDDIIVTGHDIEHVGQTAANLELATKIKQKDLRKFLDGIYIYEKKIGIEE